MSSLTDSNPLASSGSLDDFMPRAKALQTDQQPTEQRAEKALTRQSAQERGFTIDNLATVVRAKRGAGSKASKSHTLRLYIQDINRFQTWCNDHDYSQARGFEILLDKLLSA